MNVGARTATAADFDAAAQAWANRFWFFALAAVVVGFLVGWFALIPGGIAILCVIQSVSSTSMVGKLRAGTYPIPNPCNGVPDGDARNLLPGSLSAAARLGTVSHEPPSGQPSVAIHKCPHCGSLIRASLGQLPRASRCSSCAAEMTLSLDTVHWCE